MMPTPFDYCPTLEGPRVTVRPLRKDDWEGMFSAAANPRVWENHPVSDRYQESVFRGFFEDAIASGSAFAFVDRENDRIIGSSRQTAPEVPQDLGQPNWVCVSPSCSTYPIQEFCFRNRFRRL